MDLYEATRMVLSRIQSLEPDNATKIMGYLLLQDYGEKEMIRLALGPDTLVHNLILHAKTQLGLHTKSPLTPSQPSHLLFIPISRHNPLSLSSSCSSSPRIINNGFDFTNPSSPSSNAWALSGFSVSRGVNNPANPSSLRSYANIWNRNSDSVSVSLSSSVYNSSLTHDEYLLQNDLSFLNDSKIDGLYDSSLEFSSDPDADCKDLLLGSEDANSGFGWKPCLYFSRGFCKNGSNCRFLHEDSVTDSASIFGSPTNNLSELEQCQELLRLKAAAQQQKLRSASPFMTSTSFSYDNRINFLLQPRIGNQRSAATTLTMGDELQTFGGCRFERNEFSTMTLGGNVCPASRQIYLTFPPDSTFREEDVSNYFSLYGPVQDVRIPHQQKRMFGFVTFVHAETVRLILAKGNPHFVCNSRVLVKPYKEKGKLVDKKQQLERGNYSVCSSPTSLYCRDSYDLNHGARMFYNTQEVSLMKKWEERASLQLTIDLHERKLMNLQLHDIKNNYHHQYHHGLSSESPIPSPALSQNLNNQASIISPDGTNQDIPEGNNVTIFQTADLDCEQQVDPACNPRDDNEHKSGKKYFQIEESELQGRMELVLPDKLFSSPKKSSGDSITVFSAAPVETDGSKKDSNSPKSTSTLNVASSESAFSKCPGYLLGIEPLECS